MNTVQFFSYSPTVKQGGIEIWADYTTL